jgi:hypothetical protein
MIGSSSVPLVKTNAFMLRQYLCLSYVDVVTECFPHISNTHVKRWFLTLVTMALATTIVHSHCLAGMDGPHSSVNTHGFEHNQVLDT